MMQSIAALIPVVAFVVCAVRAHAVTNEFKLELSHTNGVWQFVFSPTASNALYQMLGRGDMAVGNWIVEADVAGFTNGTQTVYTIANDGWNQRFFLAGSGADSDGDGLSDVYEVVVTKTSPSSADTGSTGVSDGYRDSDGDGQTDLQEYVNRLDPFEFTTPAAPTDFFVTQLPGQYALIRWNPAYGALSGYVIQRKADNAPESAWVTIVSLTNLSQTSYSDTTEPPLSNAVYRMWATYTNGQSSLITASMIPNQSLGAASADAVVTRGKGGKLILVVPGLPAGVETVRLYRTAEPVNYPFSDVNPGGPAPQNLVFLPDITNAPLEIASSAFSNGMYVLPDSFVPDYGRYSFESQLISTNGLISARQHTPFSTLFENWTQRYWYGLIGESASSRIKFPWIDTRAVSEENLRFSVKDSIAGGYDLRNHAMLEPTVNLGFLDDFCFCPGPTPDVESGFIAFGRGYFFFTGMGLDPFASLQLNHLYRNWVFDAADLLPDNRPDTHSWSCMRPWEFQHRECFDQKYWFSVPNYITNGATSTSGYTLADTGLYSAQVAVPVDYGLVPTN